MKKLLDGDNESMIQWTRIYSNSFYKWLHSPMQKTIEQGFWIFINPQRITVPELEPAIDRKFGHLDLKKFIRRKNLCILNKSWCSPHSQSHHAFYGIKILLWMLNILIILSRSLIERLQEELWRMKIFLSIVLLFPFHFFYLIIVAPWYCWSPQRL